MMKTSYLPMEAPLFRCDTFRCQPDGSRSSTISGARFDEAGFRTLGVCLTGDIAAIGVEGVEGEGDGVAIVAETGVATWSKNGLSQWPITSQTCLKVRVRILRPQLMDHVSSCDSLRCNSIQISHTLVPSLSVL